MEKQCFFYRRPWQIFSVLFVSVIFVYAICGLIFLLSWTQIITGVTISAIVSLITWFILNQEETKAKLQGKALEFYKIPLFISICAACLFLSFVFQIPPFIEGSIVGLVVAGFTLLILRLIYWKEIKTKK